MSERKITITIDCEDEVCGKCPQQQWGQFDTRECLFGSLTDAWMDLDSTYEDLTRFPECIKAEQKGEE